MPARHLLNPAPEHIESVPGQADDMARIHDRNRLWQFLGRGAYEAGEPVHGHDFYPVPLRLGAFLQPGGEDLLRASFDHVQQAGGPGFVADRSQVNDDRDVHVPVAGLPPTCSSTPMTFTPTKRLGSSMSTPKPSATRATVRCWHTMPSNAQASPRRQSLARGSAALVTVTRSRGKNIPIRGIGSP